MRLQHPRIRLGQTRLYALVDGKTTEDRFDEHISRLIQAGVDAIQLRDKSLPDRDLLARGRRLSAATRETRVLFIMNDRPDLAVLAQADGVHLGQDELSVCDARRMVGSERLIGVSTHTLEQAHQAVQDGADYLGVGPTFRSTTKAFDHFPGVELLAEVASEIGLPAFAIGGITVENLDTVLQTGIGRVAVQSAVASTAAMAEFVCLFRKRMEMTAPGAV